MRSHELTIGRTFGLAVDDGEDFFAALEECCRSNTVRQGYIPYFLAGFSAMRISGTCEQVADPAAPVRSPVYLTNAEVHGGGTIAYDPERETIAPHIHVSAGLKHLGATGYTSHLFQATVQTLTEMVIVEVLAPHMRRTPDPGHYGTAILGFDT